MVVYYFSEEKCGRNIVKQYFTSHLFNSPSTVNKLPADFIIQAEKVFGLGEGVKPHKNTSIV